MDLTFKIDDDNASRLCVESHKKDPILLDMMEVVTSVIMDVCKVDNYKLAWVLDDCYRLPLENGNQLPDLFVWKYTKKFETLSYWYMDDGTSVNEEYKAAQEKFLKFLQEEVVADGMWLKTETNECTLQNVQTVFKQRNLNIYNCYSSSCLIGMECEVAKVYMHTVQIDDLNTVLKDWIDGKIPN